MTPGYFDEPEATAAILRHGWLWTGDLASRDAEGFFFHRPLSADELELLQSKAGVTGLDTVEIRRLLANSTRLRQLVVDAARLLTPNSEVTSERAREVREAIRDEAGR